MSADFFSKPILNSPYAYPSRHWELDEQGQPTQKIIDTRRPAEFITPYTPEQNGIIERFFRSLKEECVWQHVFQTFEEARRVIRQWLQWYNEERPHDALAGLPPTIYRAQLEAGRAPLAVSP